ncbi:MAG: alpha/beta hydrolase [Actinomycetota bacterium]
MSTEGAPAGWLEDYSFDGATGIGILLLHGFTGSPASMRPWAHYLPERGFSVRVPRIPGHGRRWQDLNKTKWQSWPERAEEDLMDLLARYRSVCLVGLSLGGANTLYLAAKHSSKLSGIVLVNPMIHIPDPTIKFIEIIKYITPKRPSVGDDIKKPGVTEWGYDALPMKGVAQLHRFLKATRANLKRINCPVLLFHSTEDHVLPVSNTEIVMSELGTSDKRRIELTNSYHVATLDYDDQTIFENARLFIEEKTK